MGMVSGSVKSHSCMRCKVEATAFVTMIPGAECRLCAQSIPHVQLDIGRHKPHANTAPNKESPICGSHPRPKCSIPDQKIGQRATEGAGCRVTSSVSSAYQAGDSGTVSDPWMI